MTIYIPALLQTLKATPAYHYPIPHARPIPLSLESATKHEFLV